MKSKIPVVPIVIAIAAIGLIVFGIMHYYSVCTDCVRLNSFSPEDIRKFIQGFGNWAIVVFCLLYTANTFSPFLPPIAGLSLSAGALFGPIWGTVALTLGTFCGTTAAFFVSRYVGRSKIEGLLKGKGEELYEKLSDNGFFVLLPMRLIGLPPYGIIDFICGLSKIRYLDFISATMLGAVPWIIVQVLLADRIAVYSGQFSIKDPGTWFDGVLFGLVGAFILMIVVTGKIVKNKQASASAANPSTQ